MNIRARSAAENANCLAHAVLITAILWFLQGCPKWIIGYRVLPHMLFLSMRRKYRQRSPESQGKGPNWSSSCNLPRGYRGENAGTAIPFLYLGARLGQVVNAMPWPLCPRETDLHPLYKSLVEPRSRYGRTRKSTPPAEFQPRTVELVASRHTDYAIQ